MGETEFVLPRMGRGHGDANAADADTDEGAELEELKPDRAARGPGELGVDETDAAERTEQHIGHGSEPEAQLVGTHGGGGGAVGEQVELAFLDPVLHLTTRAVDGFVEMPGVDLGGLERGDDEAGVGFPLGPFGLADDTALAAPAVERRPGEILEVAGRLSGRGAPGLGGREFGADFGDQASVARETEDVVDAVGFAPGHQAITAEAGIGTEQNPHPRPAPANLADNAADLLGGTGRSVDVGAPQFGREQVPAAEDVERQIAEAIVVAMKEPAFLMPVQGIVGRIEIEDDLLRYRLVGLQEDIDEQPLDRRRIVAHLVVARRLRPAEFKAIERALARQRRAVRSPRLELAGQYRHHRILPKRVVVVQILVAERHADNPLQHQGPHLVFNEFRRAPIGEARRKPLRQPDRPIRGTQKQRTRIRRHRPAVETRHHTASFNPWKFKQIRATLCRHREIPPNRKRSLLQKHFRRFGAPMHLPS